MNADLLDQHALPDPLPNLLPPTVLDDPAFLDPALAEPQQAVATIPEQAVALAGPTPPVIQEGPGALLSAIVGMARDKSIDREMLAFLMDRQERMEERQAALLFDDALARIQSQMPRVPKNGILELGPGKGKYDFGKWEDVDAVVKPIAAAEGFSYTFSEEAADANGIRWGCTWRAFGHREKNYITLPADSSGGKNAIQARGSTNSYAKRYLVADFLKIVFEGTDDDGKRGGMKFIDTKQVDVLTDLCKRAGREESTFLLAMVNDAHTFSEVETRDYDRLVGNLETVIKIREERAAGKKKVAPE